MEKAREDALRTRKLQILGEFDRIDAQLAQKDPVVNGVRLTGQAARRWKHEANESKRTLRQELRRLKEVLHQESFANERAHLLREIDELRAKVSDQDAELTRLRAELARAQRSGGGDATDSPL